MNVLRHIFQTALLHDNILIRLCDMDYDEWNALNFKTNLTNTLK